MKKVTSEPLLLDVNVLLALAWPNHQFHGCARQRLERGEAWASCALTQLAFVRLFVTPAVVGVPKPIAEALEILSDLERDRLHVYWPDLPSLEEARRRQAFAHVLGHRQVNDAYLLDLARRHHGRLLTFDRRLAGLGDTGAVEVLGAQ